MEPYIYLSGTAFLALIGKFFYDYQKKRPADTPASDTQIDILHNLAEKMDQLATPRQPEDPAGVVERVETLERRFERLHKDCLRYLQQGGQTWKRIQDRAENEEEDYQEVERQSQQVMSNSSEPEEIDSDLDWAKQQMILKGETPII
jgi:hypothetical protein